MVEEADLAHLAVYHPWPLMRPAPLSNWAKNMLLFFDGLALVAPPEAAESLPSADLQTVAPLVDSGLFRFLDPVRLIDEDVANRMLDFLLEVATSPKARAKGQSGGGYPPYTSQREWTEEVPGTHDWSGLLWRHDNNWGRVYSGKSLRRYEFNRDVAEAAEMVWQELFRRGLAVERSDLHPVLLHPAVWATFQALLVHAVRPSGLCAGLDLEPCTDELALFDGTLALAKGSLPPTQANVIASDLNNVGLDLSRAPLDDVLAFREDHGRQYRAYAAELRAFVAEMAPMSNIERRAAFKRRKADFDDAAQDLRRLSRRRWRQPMASITIGIAGAAWSGIHGGDAPSALLALLGGIVGANVPENDVRGAYSYVFEAQRSLSY